jgi:hypothetical protein
MQNRTFAEPVKLALKENRVLTQALKPSVYIPERFRGFENPLPRTRSPGLARIQGLG